jgi:hypothetical protein
MALKQATDLYLPELQELTGSKAKILSSFSTELNVITTIEGRSDRAFLCDDGSIINYEFESSDGGMDSLVRFVLYAAILFYRNFEVNKKIAPVEMIVLYPAGVKITMIDDIIGPNRLFSMRQMSLDKLIDSEALLQHLKDEMASGLNPFKSRENRLKLSLAVLAVKEKKRPEFYRDSVNVVRPFFDDEDVKRMAGIITVAASSCLKKEELAYALKELDMESLLELADFISKGHISAQAEENAKLEARLLLEVEAKAKAEKAELEARARAEKAELEARARAEKAELEAKARAEKAELEAKARAEKAELLARAEKGELEAEIAKLKAELREKMTQS